MTASSDVRQYLRQCLFSTKPGSLRCTVHLQNSLSTAAIFATEKFGPFFTARNKVRIGPFCKRSTNVPTHKNTGSYTLLSRVRALFTRIGDFALERIAEPHFEQLAARNLAPSELCTRFDWFVCARSRSQGARVCTAHPKRRLLEGLTPARRSERRE